MDDPTRIDLARPNALEEALGLVARGERVVLVRGGVELASLVEPEAASLLDRLEDELLVREAEASMADAVERRVKSIPASEVFAELGLDDDAA